jgi:heptaprenyl diphosphate synthase
MPVVEAAPLSAAEFEAVAAHLPDDERMTQACAHLLGGRGKLLRSTIVFEAARQGPSPGAAPVRDAALAIELLHLATLAHDDVIDDGTVRRGRETAGARYGSSAASFGGLWLLGQAVELVAGGGEEAVTALADAISRLCAGQMREVQDLYDVDRDEGRYFEAIEGKTASLFALSAELGGKLAGAPADVSERLRTFGHELGMAYQVSDDVLDVSGTEEALGKPPGSDLRQGVFTLPVIYAMDEMPALRDRLGRPYDKAEVPELVVAIESTTGLDRARADCERHARRAREALAGLDQTERMLGVLDYAVERIGGEVVRP